jgi:Tol biopolymer transport system component
MKKILMSTIVLLAFSLSIILFQLSCKKQADAASTTVNAQATQQNKILYLKDIYGGSAGANAYDSAEIWVANYDGTNQQKVNITLPTGYVIVLGQTVKVSPDGKTIFFDAFSPGSNYPNTSTPWSIFASNIDGSNVHLVVTGTATESVETTVAF